MANYDLIVIGAGPAGYVAAIKAAQLGKARANAWNLPPVGAAGELRPGNISAYPYLARYGYG